MYILEIIEQNWIYLFALATCAILSGIVVVKKVKILKEKNQRIVYHYSIWENDEGENSPIAIIPTFAERIYYILQLFIFVGLIVIYLVGFLVNQDQIPHWLVYLIASTGFIGGILLRYISNKLLWQHYQKKYSRGFPLGNYDYNYGGEICLQLN